MKVWRGVCVVSGIVAALAAVFARARETEISFSLPAATFSSWSVA